LTACSCNAPPLVEPPAEIFPIVEDDGPRCTAAVPSQLLQCNGTIVIPDVPSEVIPKKTIEPIKGLEKGGAQ